MNLGIDQSERYIFGSVFDRNNAKKNPITNNINPKNQIQAIAGSNKKLTTMQRNEVIKNINKGGRNKTVPKIKVPQLKDKMPLKASLNPK
jgi:hypothetical protein